MLFLNQVSSDKKIIDTKCGIAQVEFEKQEIASRYRAWISSLDDDDNRVVLSLYVPSFMKLDKPLETNSLWCVELRSKTDFSVVFPVFLSLLGGKYTVENGVVCKHQGHR